MTPEPYATEKPTILVAPGRSPVPKAVIAAAVVEGTTVWMERMSSRTLRSTGVCPMWSASSS